jgi:alginate O-acetyltransferase complex protein AlgI
LLAGALFLAAAPALGSADGGAMPATASLLVGLSLALHFGLFELLVAAWRAAGVDCRSLFRSPLRSRDLREFWSRRWNLAFSEMTALVVHRPLARRLGRRAAVLGSFLFSGLLHETAISLPARAGFGLPTLYFALQGAGVLFEEGLARSGMAPRGWAERVWTAAWLLAPLPLLFHPPFVRAVLWPLAGIGGGVSAG